MEILNGKGKSRRTIKSAISRIRKENNTIRTENEPRRIPLKTITRNDAAIKTKRRTTITKSRRLEKDGYYIRSR